MTRAKDISKIVTDANFSGTLDVAGDLTSSGNMGIGVVPNSSWHSTLTALQIGGNASLSAQSAVGASKQAYFSQNVFNDGDQKYISTDEASNYYQGDGKHVFQVASSGTANNTISFTTAMTIDNSGKVGLGIDPSTLPSFISHAMKIANGGGLSITSPSAGDNRLIFFGTGTSSSDVQLAAIKNSNSELMFLGAAGAERMRIDSSGNVGIGASSPSAKLDVNGTIVASTTASQGARIERNGTTGGANIDSVLASGAIHFRTGTTERLRILADGRICHGATASLSGAHFTQTFNSVNGTGININSVDASGNAHAMMIFTRNGATVGSISTNASATAYNTSSDYRLKENVVTEWDATTRLKQLKPSRFNFIADADRTVDGFLAHEVQDIVPEAITGTHNEVDDDGNAVMQGIDQSKLVPLLVKTIQELEARITALEGV